MNKTAKILTLCFMVGITTTGFAANVGSNVQPSNWSYQAVRQLTKSGLITGVDMTAFNSNKPVGRYQMAEVVFKAMENYNKADENQKLLIDALKDEYQDVYHKVLDSDKNGESNKQTKFSVSGMFSSRYRNQNYDSSKLSNSLKWQYRLRLNGNFNIDNNSSVGFRFVTKAPNKNNLSNDSWTNGGGDNEMSPNGTSNTYTNLIDRYYYTAKLGKNTLVTVGEQALVVDPMNIIVDNTFYSYGGGKIVQKFPHWGHDTELAVQYGSFYKGASFVGAPAAWGSKKFTDFSTADIFTAILSGKVQRMKYQLGYADFKNTTTDVDLLRYVFANTRFLITSKLGLEFEYAKNHADDDGQFISGKIIYGDQELKKKGQWNVFYQYIDAQKNAIFNRYAMLEGASGINVNHAQTISDIRGTYAFSSATSFYLDWLDIHDKDATTTSNGSSKLLKAELDVKF